MNGLEIFEAIAEDNVTVSYLARWQRRTWIVLRRAQGDEATEQLGAIAPLARRIQHPHVVRTLEPGAELGALQHAVLFEEYVHGDRLDAWMLSRIRKPIPWQVAVAIVRDAALGAAAVRAVLLLREEAVSELWPGRIVVGMDGMVRVVDPCAELRGVELPSALRARYGAPELLEGAPGEASAVYALGRILMDLCASPGNDDMPKALERIVARATEPRPGDRHHDLSQLAVALDALLEEPKPIRAYCEARRAEDAAANAVTGGDPVRQTLESAKTAPVSQRRRLRRTSASGMVVVDRSGRGGDTQRALAVPSSDQLPIHVRPIPPSSPNTAPSPRQVADDLEAPNTDPMMAAFSSQDFDEDYDPSAHDELLSEYVADEREDALTLPIRRELLARLQRDEHEELGGGAGVAVAAARAPRATPAPVEMLDSVQVTESGRRPIAAPTSATVLVRRPAQRPSASPWLWLVPALLVVAALVGWWVVAG